MVDNFILVYLGIAIGSSLSIIGNIFIILVYLKYNELHTFTYKIILILSIFNIIEGICIVIPANLINHDFCIIQGFFNQFFGLNSILWTGSISLVLYLQIVKESKNIIKYAKIFFTFTILISLFISIAVLLLNGYKDLGGKDCWINNNGVDYILRFVFFYIPAWIVALVNSFVYWSIIKKINKTTSSFIELDNQRRHLSNKLKYYPFILIVTLTPLTIYRVLEVYTTSIWFYAVSMGFFSSTGFLNSIAYGLNETIRQKLFPKKEPNYTDILFEQIQY